MGGHGQPDAEVGRVEDPSGELEWNATLLEGDISDSVPKLKEEVDGDLFMHGSGEFATPSQRRASSTSSRST